MVILSCRDDVLGWNSLVSYWNRLVLERRHFPTTVKVFPPTTNYPPKNPDVMTPDPKEVVDPFLQARGLIHLQDTHLSSDNPDPGLTVS
ncbi:hypothetical protein CDAR_473231 [Caerostris darwini]|uniref:Uncharacterized protein n=1 Tax=Caerostris darwini TaxID=1538125 RepID=A0AAV4PK55_9ARAC|nr:hypothetical protein CDAR_473111 [Caerostris darwini]GIX97398.1 hypothetical protein CDAR_473231 [Caerostris darwini]